MSQNTRLGIVLLGQAPPTPPLTRLVHEGEQYTPQFLERFEPLRRYATLVAYLLDDHYSHIRKYAPELLETFTFHAAPSSQLVAEALTLVRDLGRKKVPENAPLDFIKPRWKSHVVTDDGIDRHYYELCALSGYYMHHQKHPVE